VSLRYADAIEASPPTAELALVSMIAGERYQRCWHEVAKPTWTAYADRHGLDIVLIRFPLDRSARALGRSIAWQKCLIPEQDWSLRYRRLCWCDADILINPEAPSIFGEVAEERIGAVCVHDQLSAAEKHVLLERVHRRRFAESEVAGAWDTTQHGLYREAGIKAVPGEMVQTGVVVFSPERDRKVFANAYARDRDTRAYEQPSLSYEILHSGRMHRLSARWNWGLWDAIQLHHQNLMADGERLSGSLAELASIAGRELGNAYFLHFYRMFGVLETLRPQLAPPR
jgi:hypothetical protein